MCLEALVEVSGGLFSKFNPLCLRSDSNGFGLDILERFESGLYSCDFVEWGWVDVLQLIESIGQVFNTFSPTASCRATHRLKE